MDSVKIRDFSENDVDQITDLMQTLCKITKIEFSLPRWQASIKRQFEESDKSRFFIAEKDGIIIGMAFASVRRTLAGNRFGYVANLIVDSKFRGQRIGEWLLQSAVDFFKHNHIDMVRVAVRKESPEALHLLKRLGFNEEITILEQKI